MAGRCRGEMAKGVGAKLPPGSQGRAYIENDGCAWPRKIPPQYDKRSRALTEDLRTKINSGEIEGLERRIAIGARNDKLLAGEPIELFKKRVPVLTDRLAV